MANSGSQAGYLYEPSAREYKRLGLLGDMYDRLTFSPFVKASHRFCDPFFVDVGCGAGTIRTRATAHGFKYLGVDSSPPAVLPPSEGAAIVNADCLTLPIADESVQFIHARLLISHVPGADNLLNELWRALAPGGLLVVAELEDSPVGNFLPAFDLYRTRMKSIARLNSTYDKEVCKRMPSLLSELRPAAKHVESSTFVNVSTNVNDAIRMVHRLQIADRYEELGSFGGRPLAEVAMAELADPRPLRSSSMVVFSARKAD